MTKEIKWLVVHFFVHVKNAKHAAENGLLGLLRAKALPDKAQRSGQVGNRGRDASAEKVSCSGC